MQDTLLAALRHRTAPHHERIERLLGLGGDIGLDRYGEIVRGFESFHAQWEPRLRAALPAPMREWFDARCRGPLAARDLAALGLEAERGPATFDLRIDSPCAAIGSLYVIEGSALGGQVVARQLQRQHARDARSGAAYFHGAGERTGAQWREFLGVLSDHDARGCNREAACEAAAQTFGALHSHFEQVLHHVH